MKYAFSTIACPGWDAATIALRAREYGYDGVELAAFRGDSFPSVFNPTLADRAKVRDLFSAAGVDIACLSTFISFGPSHHEANRLAEELKANIDTAHILDCPLVKILDPQPGVDSQAAKVIAFAEWLLPLADYAAQCNVTLLVENAVYFHSAAQLWTFLDYMSHPFVAACWDILAATLDGLAPSVCVPVLNSRIRHVHIRDAKITPEGVRPCQLGDGDVPVNEFLSRFQGIGYAGYLTFQWNKIFFPDLAEPEPILREAITRLHEWTRPRHKAIKPAPVAQP